MQLLRHGPFVAKAEYQHLPDGELSRTGGAAGPAGQAPDGQGMSFSSSPEQRHSRGIQRPPELFAPGTVLAVRPRLTPRRFCQCLTPESGGKLLLVSKETTRCTRCRALVVDCFHWVLHCCCSACSRSRCGMRCRTSSRRRSSRNCLPRATARASSVRCWRPDPRRSRSDAPVLCPAPACMSSVFRRTSRRRLPASLPIAAALRPRFRDVTSACRLIGGTAHSRSRKECHRVSINRMDRRARACRHYCRLQRTRRLTPISPKSASRSGN